MPVIMAGDHQLWKYNKGDALKRIVVLKMRHPKEGAVEKQHHTGYTRMKVGHCPNQRKKQWGQYVIAVPFARAIIDITGRPP
jgi:hypothetical protein